MTELVVVELLRRVLEEQRLDLAVALGLALTVHLHLAVSVGAVRRTLAAEQRRIRRIELHLGVEVTNPGTEDFGSIFR